MEPNVPKRPFSLMKRKVQRSIEKMIGESAALIENTDFNGSILIFN